MIFVKVASRVAFSVLYAGIHEVYTIVVVSSEWPTGETATGGSSVSITPPSRSLFFFTSVRLAFSRCGFPPSLSLSQQQQNRHWHRRAAVAIGWSTSTRLLCASLCVRPECQVSFRFSLYRLSPMNRSNSEAEALDQKTRVSNVHEDSWGKAIFYELYMYTVISICRSIR